MSSANPEQPSQRAAALADQFDQIRGEVVDFVRACPPDQWRTVTDSEGWPLAVVANHIALSYSVQAGWIRSLAHGEPVSMTMDDIHEGNERARGHAEQRPDAYSHEAVIARLEGNGQETSATIRALTDAELQLQAPFGPAGRPLSAGQVIKHVLLVHTRDHLESMRASLARAEG